MQKNYFRLYNGVFDNAGGKAKQDAETIFANKNYQNRLSLPEWVSKNIYLNTLLTPVFGLFQLLKSKKNSTYIFQYPTFFLRGVFLLHLYETLNQWKGNKKIVLVHDLEELRKEKIDKRKSYFKTKFSRAAYLKKADAVIVHNSEMKKWIIEQGIAANKVISLKIFDYLGQLENDGGQFGNQVIMAGNLDSKKVRSLENIHRLNGVHFNLYGPNLDQKVAAYPNVSYHGSYPADQVAGELKGSYGLIWDSTDFSGGAGAYAKYQRYNSPHKLSLYLAAGFPVILWEEAALAPFVLENELGIVIGDLTELPEKVAAITEPEYRRMKENSQRISKKICSGHYLNRAIDKAEELIKEGDNDEKK